MVRPVGVRARPTRWPESFLEPVDGVLERMDAVHRVDGTRFDTDALPVGAEALVVLPDAP